MDSGRIGMPISSSSKAFGTYYDFSIDSIQAILTSDI